MHDESIDRHTAAFLDEVRAAFEVGAPPPPRPELAALFVSGLTSDKGDLSVTAASKSHGSAPQTSGLPNWTRRHIDMLNDVMEQVRSKAVAAAAGAALVLSGMGASGALDAPLRMIGLDSAPTEECVAPTDPVPTTVVALDGATDPASVTDPVSVTDPTAGVDGTAPDAGDTAATDCTAADGTGTAADGTDGSATTDDATGTEDGDAPAVDPAVDPGTTTEPPPVATTATEAAHVHDFDEACGNHGAYVSHVARFGEEPECATAARGASAGTGQDPASGDATAPTSDEGAVTGTGDGAPQVGSTQSEATSPQTHGQGQGRHAAAKSGRGKSGK